MAKQVFYLITDDQAGILIDLGLGSLIHTRSGKKYVNDFQDVIDAIYEAIEPNGITDDEYAQLEAFQDGGYNEVYWSTDAGNIH